MTKLEEKWVIQAATLAAQTYIDKILPTVIENHIASCRHGKTLLKMVCISIGFGVGSGALSASVIFSVIN
jgi:hypothetical protein